MYWIARLLPADFGRFSYSTSRLRASASAASQFSNKKSNSRGIRVVVMKKAKPKSKVTAKKSAKRSPLRTKKPVDLLEVRKDITNIVGTKAKLMAEAVAGEGLKGQLAPVKYLFEVAGLYPPAEASEGRPEQDVLARTLLDRLGIPVKPVVSGVEEPALILGAAEATNSATDANDSGEPEGSASLREVSGAGAATGCADEGRDEAGASASENPGEQGKGHANAEQGAAATVTTAVTVE
jgi:hypothetical protein